jgi:CheY-like chemotaxis protein
MAQASHKITEFPGINDAAEPIASLPEGYLTQDRDPTREIRDLIEELQATAREARRRQRQAEEERERLRSELLDLQEQADSAATNPQLKALIRERDMLLGQQSQYGPVIADLKQQIRSFENDTREAIAQRDAALREKKQAQRLLEDSEKKRDEATRQRDAAARLRELSKKERDEAVEIATIAKKNFADAQKAILEARQKRGDGELSGQLVSLRQARDGMAAQVTELKHRIGELEDEAAEAGYAREAAERLARETKAELAEIRGVLEAAGGDAQKLEQLDSEMVALQAQLAGADERNRMFAENEAKLIAEMSDMRKEIDASRENNTDNSALLDEARASLVAAQKQIDAIIRDRDSIREQLTTNTIALEANAHEQAAEIERLRKALGDHDGKLSQHGQMQAQFEKRRLDMIELNAQLENAQREIRNLSASLAEARLHAKLAGRAMSSTTPAMPENRPATVQEPAQGREEIVAMRRSYQAFSRDQKQVGLLGELETLSHKIADQAVNDGHPILHRVCAAFASLLADLLEMPEQITQTTLRTLNQTIEFIALLVSDPEIEGRIKLDEARVYVVDDEAPCCATAVDALGIVGLQSNHALYSRDAIAELAANRYDLIILDVHLPDLNGFELSAHIRGMALHAETPIFFVTGDSSLENRVKSSLRGGSEFLTKPFSVQELALKALKSVITGQLRGR